MLFRSKSALGGTLGVKNIYFHNANRQYCLANPSVTIPSLYFTDGMPLKKANESTYVCYMPESIISTATWGVSGDRKPINYFTIETTEGMLPSVLGPVPIPQPRTIDSRELEGTADRVKAVVRVPQSRRGELALRLRSASARHVAAREPGELRFQLDPKERI